MSGLGAKWVVQRFEELGFQQFADERLSLSKVGGPKVCADWREACETVTLAIGDNCLKIGVESTAPVVVFKRDDTVIVVYLELRCD